MKIKKTKTPVVILAAGRGSRLGELTEDKPKCLLEVAGSTMLERQIAAIKAVKKLSPVVVVTGFKHELVTDAVDDLILECYNRGWDKANNIASLGVAADAGWLDDGFVLFNADVVFKVEMLEDLLSFERPCALVVDNVQRMGEEEMKVELDTAGRIAKIAKTLDPATAAGEYTGLAKFDKAGAAALKNALALLLGEGRLGEWYEAAFQIMFAVHDVYPCYTKGRHWIEVDTPEDLEQANMLFGGR